MKGPCIVYRLQAEKLWLESEQKQENFHFSKCSDQPRGPQTTVQRVLVAVSRAYKCRDVKLYTLLRLVLRLELQTHSPISLYAIICAKHL